MALSNREIIEGLYSHSKEVIEYIYKENYRNTLSFIINNSGNRHDAEDIFHDSLIALHGILQGRKLKLTCTFSTFFTSICKNLWFEEIRKRNLERYNTNYSNYIKISVCGSLIWESADFDEFDVNDILIQYEKNNLFRHHFERLKDVCKRILLLYFEKVPMKNIAVATGFNGEKSAKAKKYNCQEELIQNIKNDPEYIRIVNLIKVEEIR